MEMRENTPQGALTGEGRREGGRGAVCFQFVNITVIDIWGVYHGCQGGCFLKVLREEGMWMTED